MANPEIQIKLFATLNKFAPENGDHYPIPDDATVADVVTALSIPQKEAKLIFINNTRADLDSPLKSGDRLGIFPPVGGG